MIKAIIISLVVLIQSTLMVQAADSPVKLASPVDQLNIRLSVVRAALANIETMRVKSLEDIEARYLRDKESRTKFYQTKEADLKLKEQSILEEMSKLEKPVALN